MGRQVVFNNVLLRIPPPATAPSTHGGHMEGKTPSEPRSEVSGGDCIQNWVLPSPHPVGNNIHSSAVSGVGRQRGWGVWWCGGGGMGRDGELSILLLRRQRALHDLIKMPIRGLRR